MKNGRPASDPNLPPPRGGPASQAGDAFIGLAQAQSKFSPKKPRQSRKKSLTSLLCEDARLTKGDIQAVQHAASEGLSVSDLSALVTYQILMAKRFFDGGELAAKDFIVAMNKCASQAATCAQLAQGPSIVLPSSIAITFDATNAPTAVNRNLIRPTPTVTGDQIETE